MPKPLPIKISLPSILDKGATVFEVDGHDIANSARRITISSGANEVTTVELELYSWPVEFDAEAAVVQLDIGTIAALIAMGWTPPAEEASTDV